VRAFHEIYDPGLAVRTLARVRARYPEARLEMVGPDKRDGSMERARAEAALLGVEAAVEFVGAVPKAQVPERVNRGDIFLNTTTIDNTPVSVMEAMACGACVVSTRVGGVPYLVRDGEEGLLTPVGNAEAMAAAVERLLEHPELAARISQAARSRAEGFDWAAVLPQWEELLTRCAQGETRTRVARMGHETHDLV
jgi:glycosyltransferase involved in cell wall biosynthesis